MADVVPVTAQPLNINPLGYQVEKPALPDMFGRMEQMAQIRNLMNQNAIFQQTFQAKQRAGQIMATAPDVATGLQRLQQDPLTASFAPELMNSYRQLDLTNTQVQKEQQGMYTSGFQAMLHALPSAYTDASSYQNIMRARFGTLPQMTQDYMLQHGTLDRLQSALFDDLPNDPAKREAMYRQRWNALMLGGDFSPEAINAIAGKNSQIDLGPSIQPTIERPTALGGGQVPVGAPIAKTGIPPTHVDVNGTPLVIGGNQPPAENAFGADNPTGRPTNAAPAGDGTPLIPQDFVPQTGARSVPSSMNPTGMPVLTGQQKELADELAKEYGKEGLKAYDNANITMGMLKYMDNDLDQMIKGGGLTVPGTAAKFRIGVANMINTIESMTGKKPSVDVEGLMSAESFIKAMTTMRLSVLNTMLGTQREAAQTISSMGEAVPNIGNSYLGAKLLVDTFKAASQRVMDERHFDNWYMQQTGGNLTGAEEAFNKAHPAQDYAAGVLSKYGLSKDGKFSDPNQVIDFGRRGYLTSQQVKDILNKQFPGGPPKGGAAKPTKLLPDENSLGVE